MINIIQETSNQVNVPKNNIKLQEIKTNLGIQISDTYKNDITTISSNSYVLSRNNPEDLAEIKALEKSIGTIFGIETGDLAVYDVESMTENLDLPLGRNKIVGYHSLGGTYKFNYIDDQGTTGQLVIKESGSKGSKDLLAPPSFNTKDGLFPTLDDETFKQNILKAITMEIECEDEKTALMPGSPRCHINGLEFDLKTKQSNLKEYSDLLVYDLELSYKQRNHDSKPLSEKETMLLDKYIRSLKFSIDEILKTRF